MREIPFLRHLTNLASSIIQKYSDENKDFLKSNEPILYNRDEAYVVNSLLSLGEVETVFDQLEQSPYFLSNFRITDSLKKEGINRFHHIVYHIESHLFRAAGILDRLFIHINTVLNIGLTPEECKPYNLLVTLKGKEGKYNKQIKQYGSDLNDELINMLNSVNKLRDLRNFISHQGRYQSEHFKHIEMYYILLASEGPNEYKEGRYKYFYKSKTDNAIKRSKTEMLTFNNEIRLQLDFIYSRIEEIWKVEYEKLRTDALSCSPI